MPERAARDGPRCGMHAHAPRSEIPTELPAQLYALRPVNSDPVATDVYYCYYCDAHCRQEEDDGRASTSSSSATAPTRAAAGKARQAYELVSGKAAGVAPCRGQPAAVHQCLKGSYVSTHQAASSTVQLCSALRDSVVCTAVALLVWMPSCFLYHFHSYGILVGLAALAPVQSSCLSISACCDTCVYCCCYL